MPTILNRFCAATFNAGGGEPKPPSIDALRGILTTIKGDDASVLLLQEAQDDRLRDILTELGYHHHASGPESMVAWWPDRWTDVSRYDEVLNTSPYFRPGSDKPVFVKAARVILCDPLGRSIDTLSYHTPAHVQVPDAPERRLLVLRECMERIADIAGETEARGVLFGGDDNVDEDGPNGPWKFMLEAEVGLRLVQAPRPTLGRRRVDDLRIKGLRALAGRVRDVEDADHGVHLRALRWLP